MLGSHYLLQLFLGLAFAVEERCHPFYPLIDEVRWQGIIKEGHSHVEDFAVEGQVFNSPLALLLIQLPLLYAIQHTEGTVYVGVEVAPLPSLVLEIGLDLFIGLADADQVHICLHLIIIVTLLQPFLVSEGRLLGRRGILETET